MPSGPQPVPFVYRAPQDHGQWSPFPPPRPTNGFAMPALVLGVITLGLSPLPFLNQAGIPVGFGGAVLGVVALVVGVRRRVRGRQRDLGHPCASAEVHVLNHRFRQEDQRDLECRRIVGKRRPAGSPARVVDLPRGDRVSLEGMDHGEPMYVTRVGV